MPIRLILTQESNLEINAQKQNNFSITKEGIELSLPFKTIERDTNHIIIDPQGKLHEVVQYIISELEKDALSYEFDSSLKKYWDDQINEKKKIELIKLHDLSLSGRVDIPTHIFKSKRHPFPYQIQGIVHGLQTENAANFSVPGSGKTQVGLGIFVSLKKSGRVEKALVIGPASCFEPWESEAEECLAQPIRITRWSGNIPKRQRIGARIKNTDLILVTYQTACNDYQLLEQLLRKYRILLILDESHHIKNPFGVRSRIAIKLSTFASKRIILTGTPSPHSLSDLWTQFSFLWPSRQLLGDYYDFKQRIERSKEPVKILKHELSPFFVRTTKKDLGLPEIKRSISLIRKEDVPFEQRKIIELLELKTLVEARELLHSDMDINLLRNWRAARMIRLLQAASNPALLFTKLDRYRIQHEQDINTSDLLDYVSVFANREKTPIKIHVVIENAKKLIDAGKKVVIWTWFVENILLIKDLLHKYNPLMLYGGIKPYEEDEDLAIEESRERNIHSFKTRSDRPLLLANPAACAESISLHKHCQDAIYLDRNFNCGQFLQSMDRIHRVGMPSGLTATYHIPIIDCAIERAVDGRLKKRQQVLYDLLNDPMQVLGVDDSLWLADSDQEIDQAFADVLKEIKSGKKNRST